MKGLMKIVPDAEGTLVSRPNRFLAVVDIYAPEGNVLSDRKAHVRDPGRMKELLYPGNRVLLRQRPEHGRKTDWEVLAAWDGEWVLINTGYHRRLSETILLDPDISPFGRPDGVKAEVTVGHSRLDFMLEKAGETIALEVKGCTLVSGDVALFPDAPTERGAKHLRTLAGIRRAGGMAAVMFLVFRPKAACFMPNADTDPEFAAAFREAMDAGVGFHAVKLQYDGREIIHLGEIPVCNDFI